MKKEDIIALIQDPKVSNKIKSFGISKLYLFGSYAENKATKDSDIDFFYQTIPNKKFGFDFFSLVIFLEKTLKKPVGIIDQDFLNPTIKQNILSKNIEILQWFWKKTD